MAKWKTIGLWLLQILLAFVFFNVGRVKIWGPGWETRFRLWGYPENFYLFVGWWEMLGGLALLIPRTAGTAAFALIAIMMGAGGHHLWRGEFMSFTRPALFIALLSLVARARWPELLRRSANGKPAQSAP